MELVFIGIVSINIMGNTVLQLKMWIFKFKVKSDDSCVYKSYKLSYHINPVVFSKQLFFFLKRHNYDETTLWQVCNVNTLVHLINS